MERKRAPDRGRQQHSIAVFLLRNADTHILRVTFGVFVSLYAAYMLFRPTVTRFGETASKRRIA